LSIEHTFGQYVYLRLFWKLRSVRIDNPGAIERTLSEQWRGRKKQQNEESFHEDTIREF
jgi:hypothetical protein